MPERSSVEQRCRCTSFGGTRPRPALAQHVDARGPPPGRGDREICVSSACCAARDRPPRRATGAAAASTQSEHAAQPPAWDTGYEVRAHVHDARPVSLTAHTRSAPRNGAGRLRASVSGSATDGRTAATRARQARRNPPTPSCATAACARRATSTVARRYAPQNQHPLNRERGNRRNGIIGIAK